MKNINKSILLSLLSSVVIYSAVTVEDIKKINKNSFFKVWSQFLDQIVAEKKFPISDENKSLYQAFIQQGKKLNMIKLTGNKKLFVDMQKQIEGIKIRIDEEKKFFDEWNQFKSMLSPQTEGIYKSFVQRAKNLNIAPEFLKEMQTQMDQIKLQANLMQGQLAGMPVEGNMLPVPMNPMPPIEAGVIPVPMNVVPEQANITPMIPHTTPVSTEVIPAAINIKSDTAPKENQTPIKEPNILLEQKGSVISTAGQ